MCTEHVFITQMLCSVCGYTMLHRNSKDNKYVYSICVSLLHRCYTASVVTQTQQHMGSKAIIMHSVYVFGYISATRRLERQY